MTRLYLILSGILFFFTAQAQYENVWIFGSYQGGLNFNDTPPRFFESAIYGFGEASASVCDDQGQLLFYTEGTYVWNKNHDKMSTGASIVPISSVNSFSTTSSAAQGALIVKKPFSKRIYYVFSLASAEQYQSVENFERTRNFGRMYYTQVDMSLDNGNGNLVAGQTGIPVDSFLYEHMTVVPGIHCNFWIIVLSRKDNSLKAYELNYSGLSSNPVISNLDLNLTKEPDGGVVSYRRMSWSGMINANNTGNKIAITDSNNPIDSLSGLYLADFDPATGKASNAMLIDKGSFYGACFSPNDSLLYSGPISGTIYQYEVYAGSPQDVQQSKIAVGSGGSLKSAQNGKIYTLSGNGLSVINYPNLLGDACGFESNALRIPDSLNINLHIGLPNKAGVLHPDDLDHYTHSYRLRSNCFYNLLLKPGYTGRQDRVVWMDSISSNSLEVTESGTYWVNYYDYENCASFTDSFHVTIPTYTILSQPSCYNASNGSATIYINDGDNGSYQWVWLNHNLDTVSVKDTFKNAPAGNYWIYLQGKNCDTLISFALPEIKDSVSFLPSKGLICQGQSIYFQNTSGGHYTHFQWSGHESIGRDSLSRDITFPFRYAGAYKIRLIGHGDLCTDTLHHTIVVDSLYDVAFSVEKDQVCMGESVTFYPKLHSGTITELQWLLNNHHQFSSSSTEVFSYAFDLSGDLYITLQTKFRACPDAHFTKRIQVHDFPQVYLGPDNGLCLNASPLILYNIAEKNNNIYQYLWSTGDTGSHLKVVHPGNYSLTVWERDQHCKTTESVYVSKDCYIDIPNAFTPNGDGDNDYFFPRSLLSKNIQRFNMQIFNRWGQLLFETHNIDGRGWDGRFNEQEQPMGVYLYHINIILPGQQEEKYVGNVTLIR